MLTVSFGNILHRGIQAPKMNLIPAQPKKTALERIQGFMFDVRPGDPPCFVAGMVMSGKITVKDAVQMTHQILVEALGFKVPKELVASALKAGLDGGQITYLIKMIAEENEENETAAEEALPALSRAIQSCQKRGLSSGKTVWLLERVIEGSGINNGTKDCLDTLPILLEANFSCRQIGRLVDTVSLEEAGVADYLRAAIKAHLTPNRIISLIDKITNEFQFVEVRDELPAALNAMADAAYSQKQIFMIFDIIMTASKSYGHCIIAGLPNKLSLASDLGLRLADLINIFKIVAEKTKAKFPEDDGYIMALAFEALSAIMKSLTGLNIRRDCISGKIKLLFDLAIEVTLVKKEEISEADWLYKYSLPVLFKSWPQKAFEEVFNNFFTAGNESEVVEIIEMLHDFHLLKDLVQLSIENVASPEALRNHMALKLQGLSVESVEVVKKCHLGDLSLSLLQEAGLAEKIKALLHREFPSLPEDLPIYNEASFTKSAGRLLEYKETIFSDPNVDLIFSIMSKHGGMSAYYRREKAERLEELKRMGFNIDYLLSGEEVLARRRLGIEKENGNGRVESWEKRLQGLTRGLLGNRESDPRDIFSFNNTQAARMKIFAKINKERGYQKAIEGDKKAAQFVASVLLEIISGVLKREREEKRRLLEEYHDLLSGIKGELEGGRRMAANEIKAIRSRKLIPEILFDNERLACCVFKPRGEESQEISLVLLDPKIPLLEFWLEGYPEFMGVAFQYLGKTEDGQPAVFIDTLEGSRAIYSLGRSFALKSILDSLVLDARNMGARELIIYRCSYGLSAEFKNYIKDLLGKPGYAEAIREEENYYFKAVDVEDQGLADSRGNKHHYTDAFGINAKISGKKPCLVIDVDKYYEKFLINS